MFGLNLCFAAVHKIIYCLKTSYKPKAEAEHKISVNKVTRCKAEAFSSKAKIKS